MIEYNTLVVLIGVSLLGMTAGVIGSFAVLRRRALAGDALAHASLPGICATFLIFERRELHLLLGGALASALLGILVVSLLRRWTRLKEDAAIGIVLSVFFGAGIALGRMVQNRSTAASKAGLDSFLFGKTSGMIAEDVVFIAFVSAVSMLTAWIVFKELKAATFDPGFARSQGWPVFGLDLLVLALIAVTVMIGLPAVGVVLVAAMLILPAAAARFWTDRLERMICLAALFGGGIGIVGTLLSAEFERAPAGAVIVLTGSALLVTSILCAPKRGLASRIVAEKRFARDLAERTVLRELFEASEAANGARCNGKSITTRQEGGLVKALSRHGLIRERDGHVELTDKGFERARSISAGSRLWEQFLLDNPDLATTVDLSHESVEGVLTAETARELALKLASRGRWPAGEPMPEGAANV